MNTKRFYIERLAAEKPGTRQSAARKPTPGKQTSGIPAVPPHLIRAASCALALCWLLAGAISDAAPAYASDSRHEADMGEITFYPEESNASADSTLTGHIKVELLSVEMPAGGFEFEVDTTAPFQVDRPGEQIQSPGISIRNRSVVPVKLEIFQVPEIKKEDVHFSENFTGGEKQTFRLVDRISGVGEPGTAILVLGLAGKEYSQAAFEQDAIVPGRRNIFLTDIPAEEDRTLKLYGKVAPDFYGAYQFTVRPTLKISAVQATQG